MARTAEFVRSDELMAIGRAISPCFDQPLGVTNSFTQPMQRPSTVEEMIARQNVAKRFDADAVDTGGTAW